MTNLCVTVNIAKKQAKVADYLYFCRRNERLSDYTQRRHGLCDAALRPAGAHCAGRLVRLRFEP